MKKVIGIGNALTDVLINLPSDKILDEFQLPRGSMSLVDAEFQHLLSESTAGMPQTLSLGGSSGNTIRAMAKMGISTGFIGKVGNDNTGDFLEAALENISVVPYIMRGKEHSGRCISLVSPDGERTMATHLGAALELTHEEITAAMLDGFDCMYVEGYLVQNHALIKNAMMLAKKSGLQVALDLASYNIVAENLEFLHELLRDYVDILFANEEEAHAFTGESDPFKATEIISRACLLTIVKIGTKGAYIKRQGEETIHVGIMAAAKRVDTTGAGDFYSAGFLAGLSDGLSLQQCGTIGAIAAGKVIEVVGTTFSEDTWKEISRLVKKVKTDKYLF